MLCAIALQWTRINIPPPGMGNPVAFNVSKSCTYLDRAPGLASQTPNIQWDGHHGTISKFWDVAVCLFVCLSVQSGMISKFWAVPTSSKSVYSPRNFNTLLFLDRANIIYLIFPNLSTNKWSSTVHPQTDYRLLSAFEKKETIKISEIYPV